MSHFILVIISCFLAPRSFGRSVPNYSELKLADFGNLVADCELIKRNVSASYKGYYQTRPLCDFEIDIQYNYSSLSWIATFSRHQKLSNNVKLSLVYRVEIVVKTGKIATSSWTCHGETQQTNHKHIRLKIMYYPSGTGQIIQAILAKVIQFTSKAC